MSVTFTIQDAPEVEETYPCRCKGTFPCCPDCHGSGTVTRADSAPGYSLNFSNANAEAVLRAAGLEFPDGDLSGEFAPEEIPATLRRIMLALNSDLEPFTIEPCNLPGGHAGVQVERQGNVLHVQRMGAAFYSDGLSADGLKDRLAKLSRLLIKAKKMDRKVIYG